LPVSALVPVYWQTDRYCGAHYSRARAATFRHKHPASAVSVTDISDSGPSRALQKRDTSFGICFAYIFATLAVKLKAVDQCTLK
jgi:hypothetical protein